MNLVKATCRFITKSTSYMSIPFLIIIVTLCNRDSENKIIYPEARARTKYTSQVSNNENGSFKIIFYFDGDCGACYLYLKRINQFMQEKFSQFEIRYVSSKPLSENAERLIHDLRINISIEQITELPNKEIEFLNINHLHIIDPSEQVIFRTNKLDEHYLLNELSNRLK